MDGLKSWWSDCEVLAFEPPSHFAFRVLRVDFGDGVIELPPQGSTTWHYFIRGGDPGTTLEVTFDCPALADAGSGYRKNGRYEAMEAGAAESLRAIKRTAENLQ